MLNLKDLYMDILEFGEDRETRSGDTIAIWDYKVKFDMGIGFPAVTSKKLSWNTVVGELLWFLSGSKDIGDLKHYTFGSDTIDKWTIWTDDAIRWNKKFGYEDVEFVGDLYGTQWRNYNNKNVDQINDLINKLKTNKTGRYHLVMAWNPEAIANESMALPPCHIGFQCYVDNSNRLHLKWWQRSVDSFLGLPFNIASYGLLLHLLAKWSGLGVGTLTGDLGDTHLYKSHLEAVYTYLSNDSYRLPTLVLPEGCDTLEDTLKLTAYDFKDCLTDYHNAGTIKAPLSVG